jgi:Fe-S-cluster containining protein
VREGNEAARDPGIEAGDDARLVQRWIEALKSDVVRAAIADVHDEIGRAIAAASPRCEMSGRCCKFDAFGHRLYVTGLEAALTLVDAGAIAETNPDASRHSARDFAQNSGCLFQVGNTCGVHAHRPAGCRVYFCDPSWSGAMNDVAERAVEQVREIHDRFEIPYRYMEWRALLTMFDGCVGPIDFSGIDESTRITREGESLG